MTKPQERLPQRKGEIHAPGARLRVTLKQARDGSQELDIIGNRTGLRALAAVCSGLAYLDDKQIQTPANHYHLDEIFWGTDKGSVPTTIYCVEDGWAAD
jgi:hypothetical protein